MKIPLSESLNKLPLPATKKWPDGVWSTDAFSRGSLRLILFAPKLKDYQTPHDQDELYFVIDGSGVLQIDDERESFTTGDVLFVPANALHRFVEFSKDIKMWAIFWGKKGGEETSS